VLGQKNDDHDALAMAEAAQRPQLQAVPVKSELPPDWRALSSDRRRLVRARPSAQNSIRGFGSERGHGAKKGRAGWNELVLGMLEDDSKPHRESMGWQLPKKGRQ